MWRARWPAGSVDRRHRTGLGRGTIADGRDLAGRDAGTRPQELLEMHDVVGLDDQVRRVLREGQPVAVDLDVLRLAVEERRRAASSVRTVCGSVRLLDVEEHAAGESTQAGGLEFVLHISAIIERKPDAAP